MTFAVQSTAHRSYWLAAGLPVESVDGRGSRRKVGPVLNILRMALSGRLHSPYDVAQVSTVLVRAHPLSRLRRDYKKMVMSKAVANIQLCVTYGT